MLQPTGRWIYLPARRCCLMVLALSIAILNLPPRRGFADDKPSQSPTHDAVKKETKAERPPFDLTYVPADAAQVIAIRPNAIFHDPDMQPLAALANEGLSQLRQSLNISTNLKLPIEEIEQIVGSFTIFSSDKNRGLTVESIMIRVAHDFDWQKLMKQIDPKTKEIHQKDRVYYHSKPKFPINSPKVVFSYFLPDKRTIVLFYDKPLPAFLADPPDKRPDFAWDKDWKHVKRDLLAVMMDNRLTHELKKARTDFEPGCDFMLDFDTMVAGVDWKDGIDFRAYLACKEPAVAKRAIRSLKALLAESLHSLKQDAPPPEAADVAFRMQVCEDLINHVHLTRRESIVHAHTKANMTVAGFVKGVMSNISLTPR